MNSFLFKSIILGLIILSGCQFESTDEFQTGAIQPKSAPNITIINLSIPEDTVFIYTENKINFSFSGEGNSNILSVALYIDGNKYSQTDRATGNFVVSPYYLSIGNHSLSLQLEISSGSQSIADQLGHESYVKTLNRVLVVNQRWKDDSNLKSMVKDGELCLYWDEYRGSDLKGYLIERENIWGITPVTFPLTLQASFIDSCYVGEGGEYEVSVITQNDEQLRWGRLTIPPEYPKFQVSTNNQNKFVISWEKPKYYHNIEKIDVHADNAFETEATRESVTNPDQLVSIVRSLSFGSDYQVYLAFVPKFKCAVYTNRNSYEFKTPYVYNTYGARYASNDSLYTYSVPKRVSNDEFLFILEDGSLCRYSLSKGVIVEKNQFGATCNYMSLNSLVTSASGRSFSVKTNCSDNLYSGSTSNLRDYKMCTDTNPSWGWRFTIPRVVSDVNTVLKCEEENYFSVYNLLSNQKIGEYFSPPAKYSNTPIGELLLSSQGDYIYLEDDSLKIFHFVNGEFTKTWSNPFVIVRFVKFSSVNNNQIAIADDFTLFLKRCDDFSTIYSVPINDLSGYVVDIDFENNQFLIRSQNAISIHSLVDGRVVSTIPSAANSGVSPQLLLDGNIIFDDGLIYYATH